MVDGGAHLSPVHYPAPGAFTSQPSWACGPFYFNFTFIFVVLITFCLSKGGRATRYKITHNCTHGHPIFFSPFSFRWTQLQLHHTVCCLHFDAAEHLLLIHTDTLAHTHTHERTGLWVSYFLFCQHLTYIICFVDHCTFHCTHMCICMCVCVKDTVM